MMKIVILGSGNVGTALCKLIAKTDHELVQVISRNPDHARNLAAQYNVPSGTLTDAKFVVADIYIIALSDLALDTIEKTTALKNKFAVHTAGSVPASVLKNISSSYGILYPLQSLSKALDDIPEILVEQGVGFEASVPPKSVIVWAWNGRRYIKVEEVAIGHLYSQDVVKAIQAAQKRK